MYQEQENITQKTKVLLMYKLALTDEYITKEEKDIILPIYPNDIASERHQALSTPIVPPTVLIYPNQIEIESLVIRSLYEFCCRFVNKFLFSGVTITDGNPVIEITDNWTLINRKYEIDVGENKIVLRRGIQIILEDNKWNSADTFYSVMLNVYSKIIELKLLPMFTHIKMHGEKIEEMKLIVNKLKEMYQSMYKI